MLLGSIFNLIFGMVKFIVSFLPNLSKTNAEGESAALELIAIGLRFFPSDLWVLLLTNIITWTTIFFAWSIIEWVYKKIPGIS